MRYSGGGGGNVCDTCGRVYRWSTGLSRHKRLECGKEAQFHCPYCDYRAKQKVNLFAHIRRKHNPQVPLTFVSRPLPQMFPTIRSQLARMMSTDDPLKALRDQIEIGIHPTVPK